jgi:hypothetical protein
MASGPSVGVSDEPGKLHAVNNSKMPTMKMSGRILFVYICSSINKSIPVDVSKGNIVPGAIVVPFLSATFCY